MICEGTYSRSCFSPDNIEFGFNPITKSYRRAYLPKPHYTFKDGDKVLLNTQEPIPEEDLFTLEPDTYVIMLKPLDSREVLVNKLWETIVEIERNDRRKELLKKLLNEAELATPVLHQAQIDAEQEWRKCLKEEEAKLLKEKANG